MNKKNGHVAIKNSLLGRISLTLSLLISLCFAQMAFAAAKSPIHEVQGTLDAILVFLRDKEMDGAVKEERIRALISERFDFHTMSRRTLATNWRKASDPERADFIENFSELLAATYLGRIEAYTDERVEYVGEKVKGKRAIVNTLIIAKTADIPIRYKMIKRDDEWFVYDVVIEEVSLIQNYRNSYREIVKREGFSGLLAKMKQKIAELKNS
ncbi:MAG: ABC transporter substrate-binding protein [Gammaproteobacteria bacterium]|nr:ABC transporter substrate-binding protein [Gammaproteobacteria bacterium]